MSISTIAGQAQLINSTLTASPANSTTVKTPIISTTPMSCQALNLGCSLESIASKVLLQMIKAALIDKRLYDWNKQMYVIFTLKYSNLLICFNIFLIWFLWFYIHSLESCCFPCHFNIILTKNTLLASRRCDHTFPLTHPLILSRLLSIFSCPFKSYSSSSLLQLCHLSMQNGGGGLVSLSCALALSLLSFSADQINGD